MGTMAKFLMNPEITGLLDDMAGVIRHGGALPKRHGVLKPDNAIWVEFARSMAPMMQMPAQSIAQMFGA